MVSRPKIDVTSIVPRGGGGGQLPPPNSGCQNFPKGPSFDITLLHPFFGEQTRNFFKGALGASMTHFDGGARAKKFNFLVKIFQKNA